MKSVLMIGQSNMAGRGFINEVPMICNERIQMLRNGRWQMMTEPINYDRPVAGVGLAGSFAAMWCMENQEDKIVLLRGVIFHRTEKKVLMKTSMRWKVMISEYKSLDIYISQCYI